MKIKLLFTHCLILLLYSVGLGQIQTSGQLDIVIRNTNAKDYTNKTFAGFSNYDFVRARLFFDAQPAENVTAFFQLFADNSRLNIYAAYIRMSLFEQNLNIHAGLIPNTVGIWGPRTYSDKNPFIAVPLLHNYHTSYNFRTVSADINAFLGNKGNGHKGGGLPMLYDFCWNTGIEFFGSQGILDWSVAVISGSETYPVRQPKKDLPSFTSRFGIYPTPELNMTVSAYWGPYLDDDIVEDINNNDSTNTFKTNDIINQGVGIGVVYSKEYYEIFSETFWSSWDHPYFGDLSAYSSYIDFKYKFATQWYAAIRAELIRFSEIQGPTVKTEWDYPLNRYDFVIAYKMNRNVILKFNSQITEFPGLDFLDDFILATQISTSF